MVTKIPQNDKYWGVLRSRVFEHRIVELFRLSRKLEIEPILFKGWAASRYYPQSFPRQYIDIDLAVHSIDFERACTELKCETPPFLDLHDEFRTLDTLEWEDLFENSELIKIDNTDIRILRPEDHLRIICMHWLTDGGEFRDKLWDVFYLLENRSADFDWDRCLNVVSKTRRRWIVCTIGLAHKYLDLDLSGMPIQDEAANIPEWLSKTVENEWNSDVRLVPLRVAKLNFRTLVRQIRKRIPPNPISATVSCEGDFDRSSQWQYQFRSFFQRMRHSKFKI